MTRTKIKQLADEAQAAIAGVPSGLASKPAVALIAAVEEIDKLEADKAKLRVALVSVAAYPGVDKYLGLQITAAMSKVLKDTSDE